MCHQESMQGYGQSHQRFTKYELDYGSGLALSNLYWSNNSNSLLWNHKNIKKH